MAVAKAEILDAIAGLTVLELSELIKEMEEKRLESTAIGQFWWPVFPKTSR